MPLDNSCLASSYVERKVTHDRNVPPLILLDEESDTDDRSPVWKRVDFTRLNAELDELAKGNLKLDIVEMYDKSELLFLCEETARRTTAAHAVLEEITKDYEVDLTKQDLLKVTHRLYMTDDTLENMGTTGLRTQLK